MARIRGNPSIAQTSDRAGDLRCKLRGADAKMRSSRLALTSLLVQWTGIEKRVASTSDGAGVQGTVGQLVDGSEVDRQRAVGGLQRCLQTVCVPGLERVVPMRAGVWVRDPGC